MASEFQQFLRNKCFCVAKSVQSRSSADQSLLLLTLHTYIKGIQMAMQELNMQEVEQISGGDFSPGLAAFGVGIATAAGSGLALGLPGAAVGAIGYAAGYGAASLVKYAASRFHL